MQGLSIICAGLGEVDEKVGYSRDKYCLDNLKDLLRFLRRDDPENREVFKQVCRLKTVSKHLIPIIEHCQDDRDLVLNAVKVLVFLTMPIDSMSVDIPQQIEYLWELKSAITLSDTVAVIVSLLESPLENLESEKFTEDDWKLVQLVLTLFRNLLAVQDISPHQKAAGSTSQILFLRDKFMELLFREHVTDLILVITQNIGSTCSSLRQDNLLLLEIFYYMFVGQDPELVAKAHLNSLKEDGDARSCLSDLKSITENERDKRRLSRLHTSSWHSQFGGTFARFTMDGAKAISRGNPHSGSHDSLLKQHMSRVKKIARDQGGVQLMKDNVLGLLHDFVKQFLSGSYNVLMQSVREDIEKENPAVQKSDILNFFKVTKFVTSFQYHTCLLSKPNTETNGDTFCSHASDDSTRFNGNICGPISSSMNESMFLLVVSRWRDAFEGLKETNDYKFLSAAGSLLKAMIRMLELVLKLLPRDSREPQTARVLLYKLFYDQTDQGMTQFLLNLIKSFNEFKQPRSDLADLVEMIYVIVRLMEELQNHGTLRVSKKARMSRKKKASAYKVDTETIPETSTDQATLQKESAIPNAEQSANDQDGIPRSNLNDEAHTSVLPEADASQKTVAEQENEEDNLLQARKTNVLDDLCDNAVDSSDDDQGIAYNEVDFRVSTLISAFANDSIIRNVCWLLKFYKSNSVGTNHYIISMLRRISEDLELSPMLYQLSLLTIFYEILVEQKSCPSKEFTAIVQFLMDLVRKMLRKLKHQPLLFVELLFSKTRRECHHINADYLLHEVGNLKKQSANTGIDGEFSATRPALGRRSIADALGDDEADVIITHNFGSEINEMNYDEELETATPSNVDLDGKEDFDRGRSSIRHEHEKVSKRKRRLVLSGELETKVRELYEKFKDDHNCSHQIAEALDPDGKVSSAQVMNKLKQLGLKIPGKKRMRYSDGLSGQKQHDGNINAVEGAGPSLNSNELTQGLRRQPSHTRKRVSALTEDQEVTLRALFDKFKDHKRCSYMIAKAFDGDATFTAAEISRKLKQLGLHISKQKKTQDSFHIMDDDPNNSSANGVLDSDSETLVSMLRNKNKEKSNLTDKQSRSRNIGKKLSKDESDDELLSSLLQNNTKRSKKEKFTISAAEEIQLDEGSEDMIIEDLERHGEDQPYKVKTRGSEHANGLKGISDGGRIAEVETTSNAGSSEQSPIKDTSALPLEQLDDELADSGDDVSPDAPATTPVTGRRLRVVLDLDDED